ncbi:hypothetical protein MTP10_14530 [Nonomuraea sp. 3-1Str]|uniref:hypothetical protein n=1 Tax=Nonomuraea sp. 3-1Str TaxID=2929801 RepID=UPI002857303A|nr:hypothetical protein [Nonomuraea sp. 3-1Str]MDR8409951.1 hypothetical protein [Nonomuraea sp. 3-1Str]
MKSSPLARKAAAFGASATVLAGMVAALVASPAQAATPVATATPAAGTAGLSAAATATKSAPKVSVSTPRASKADYEGSCPVNVTFSSKIKVAVKGKTTLAYRWLHGDGSKGKIETIKLKGHGAKYVKVSEKLSFKENVKGWEAVQVLGPRKAVSKKGYFSVSCQSPIVIEEEQGPEVSARVWASPSSYVGACTPGDKIDFTGRIKVSDPTWVKYRWVLNGKVVDYGRTKVYSSKTVGFGISPRESQRGYAQLEILGPDRTSSNRAYYKVWCKDEAPATRVSVSSLVTATNNVGCKVGAHATLSSTGRARVEYTWLVNGKAVDSDYAYFSGAGSRTVTLSDRELAGDATKGGKITLTASGAGSTDSITQSYAACETPKPTVSVSAVSQTGQRNDMCADKRGPGVDFKATLTSTGATTVKYYWLVNGEKDGGELTREVNGSLDVTWGIGGTHNASETKGNIQLVVVSPTSVTSGNAAFSAVCPKPVAG